MSKSMVEKLREFLDSEEGKKSIEEFGNKIRREEELKDRWIEKFKKLAEPDIDSALSRLIKKYDSDEYVRREYSLGYEPREKLLWVAFNYAEKYCKECTDEKYLNMFCHQPLIPQFFPGAGSIADDCLQHPRECCHGLPKGARYDDALLGLGCVLYWYAGNTAQLMGGA